MTRLCLCPRGPVGACASSRCGTRRGDCGAVCPGVLMQCPGAHTQVPASLPHFLKTAPSRPGIRAAPGRAAGRCLLPGAPPQSPGGAALTPSPTGPRRAGGRKVRTLPWPSPPLQLWALGPALLLLVRGAVKRARGAEAPPGAAVRSGSGWGAAGPGAGPSGPALGSAARRPPAAAHAAGSPSAKSGQTAAFPPPFLSPGFNR